MWPILFVLAFMTGPSTEAVLPPGYEARLTALLEQVVSKDGTVDYDQLRGPLRADFDRVLKTIQTFEASTLTSDAEKLAFWINAYNVLMLNHIIEAPEVTNIVDDGKVDAFFKTPIRAANLDISLDQIEHVMLRKETGPEAWQAYQVETLDPRIHVALNCAAISCPRLQPRAFSVATLDATLEAAMRDFVNSPHHFRKEGSTFFLSSLLDWFGADFDSFEPAGTYLLGYMDASRPDADAFEQLFAGRTSAEIKQQPHVQFSYNWDVNALR